MDGTGLGVAAARSALNFCAGPRQSDLTPRLLRCLAPHAVALKCRTQFGNRDGHLVGGVARLEHAG